MKKYYYKLTDLVSYLQGQSKETCILWIYNFLSDGHTSPLIGVSLDQYRSSIIENLYLSSDNTEWRRKLRDSIKEIYKMTPLSEFKSHMFIELLKCVALLNLTDLLPDLYKEAFNSTFKNKQSSVLPDYIDLHTVILKTLFGLTHEKHEIEDIINIAKRDISNEKYTLECFNFLKSAQNTQCIEYIPLLLGYAVEDKRNYLGAVDRYLKSLITKNNILNVLYDLGIQIQNKCDEIIIKVIEIVKKFQPVLYSIDISFSQKEKNGIYRTLTNEIEFPICIFEPMFLSIYQSQLKEMNKHNARIDNKEFLKELSKMNVA